MTKTKIDEVAKQLNTTPNQLLTLKKEKLKPEHWSGIGKNTYFTEDGVELLRLALDVPLAVPGRLMGRVIHEARNPNWVYCQIDGVDGKKPVAIPRRLRGKLNGKRIAIDAITDVNGTTYRHEMLGR